MATAKSHRQDAERLLETAVSRGYAPASPARLALLAEAQVHATLALIAEPVTVTAPVANITSDADAQATADAVLHEARKRTPRARKSTAKPATEEAAK